MSQNIPHPRTPSRRILAGLTAAVLVTVLFTPLSAAGLPPEANPRFVQVEAGHENGVDFSTVGAVLGLTDDGRVFAWGRNFYGSLGLGASVTEQLTPTEVVLPLDESDRVVQLSLGSDHALALTLQGRVLAWGRNQFGQLGLGDTTTRYLPTLIGQGTFPNSSGFAQIVQVSAGAEGHSLALGSDGQVYAWGHNDRGQTGTNDAGTDHHAPQRVIDSGATQVRAGSASSFALLADGTLQGWGDNAYGQLGDGTTGTNRAVPTATAPFPGLGGDTIVQVVAGISHTAALTQNGAVYIWGDDNTQFHPLGLGGAWGTDDNSTPTPVLMPTFPAFAPSEKIIQIELGDSSSLALTSTGALYTWGNNGNGQLGLGDSSFRSIPSLVTVFPAVLDGAQIIQASAGDKGIVVVSETGGVYGVGVHGGSVGDASIEPRTWGVPWFTNIRLADLSGTVALSAGVVIGTPVTALPASWNPGSVFSYQWRLDGANIPDATASSYTPVAADAGGNLDVVLTASAENYRGASTTSLAHEVLSPPPGIPPAITTTSLPSVEVGLNLVTTIAVTGTAPITFSGTFPPGFNIHPTLGEISGSTEVAGSYPVSVTATNAFGSTDAAFTIIVAPGPVVSIVLSVSDATPVEGDEVELSALGFDEFDNLVGDVTVFTEFSSDEPADEVEDELIVLGPAGTRTITGEFGEGITGLLQLVVAPASTGPGDDDDEGDGDADDHMPLTGTELATSALLVALALLLSGALLFGVQRRRGVRTH